MKVDRFVPGSQRVGLGIVLLENVELVVTLERTKATAVEIAEKIKV